MLRQNWKVNLMVWVIVIFITVIYITLDPEKSLEADSFFWDLLYFSSVFFYCVLHNRMLFNWWLRDGKWKSYLVGFLMLWPISAFCDHAFYARHPDYANQTLYLHDDFLNVLIILLFGAGVRALYLSLQKRFDRIQAEVVSSREELRYLQNQVNPHFLFNALNSLYASTLTHPDLTKELILQLSRILRYQLESTRRTSVALAEEISYIDDLVAFEQRRLGQRLTVKKFIQVDSPSSQVAPLLFTPLLENAFKHSVGVSGSSWVEIVLKQHGRKIAFCTTNSLQNEGAEKPKGMGLGLENLKQRLSAHYPARHLFEVGVQGQLYHAVLEFEI